MSLFCSSFSDQSGAIGSATGMQAQQAAAFSVIASMILSKDALINKTVSKDTKRNDIKSSLNGPTLGFNVVLRPSVE